MQLEEIDRYRYRIPRDRTRGMNTDVLVYSSPALLDQIQKDASLAQAVNVSMLPGIVGPSLAMPDMHQGYGFPIGGVAATDWNDGVVSPGGVGFDINCGVRLVRTSLGADDVRPRLRELINQVFRDVPCGTGGEGPIQLKWPELDEVLVRGAQWVIAQGFGEPADGEFAEERGALKEADPDKVSSRAKERGRVQLGTIGSGNHFLEVQYVEQVHDAEAARAMGFEKSQVLVLIHCGSRGLGHQVCTDYLAQMGAAMKKYKIDLPDRQLACVPIQSPEGQAYLGAMRAAANFAWANRQAILHFLRGAFRRVFPEVEIHLIYDVCHNIAKRERHRLHGRDVDVLVHRKGATRAFPPGHRELPEAYQRSGQPVLIPGSMGTASWVLVGADGAMQEHSAASVMARAV